MPYKVIYLTGAPASGKSSLTRRLRKLVTPISVFEYGAELTSYVNEVRGGSIDQAHLRDQSSQVVTPDDVAAVDQRLIEYVEQNRQRSHIVIDSHAVTKESYGYRVTAYALDQFARLSPTQVWVLYTAPETALSRIKSEAQGRPTISIEEARFHTHLQATVAIAYGMRMGIPVYFYDADREEETLAAELASRLSR
jgi:adenylate kinase